MKQVYINHQSICTAKLYLPVEKNVQCQQKQQWNKIVNLFKITNKVTWIEVGQVNLLFNFEKVWCLHRLFWAKWELFMYCLTLLILVSTKRSHVLKQAKSWKMQVCSSRCELLVDAKVKSLWTSYWCLRFLETLQNLITDGALPLKPYQKWTVW